MSMQVVSAERFAKLFYQYQRALAIDSGDSSHRENNGWADVPPSEKSLMIAAARLSLKSNCCPTSANREDILQSRARPSGAAEHR